MLRIARRIALVECLVLCLSLIGCGSATAPPMPSSRPATGTADSTGVAASVLPRATVGAATSVSGTAGATSSSASPISPPATVPIPTPTSRPRIVPTATAMPAAAIPPTATRTAPTGILVNVKDHGAMGNGKTDDTKAIRDAIDAAPAGSTVYLPVGTYIVTLTRTTWLPLKSNVSIAGEGPSSVIRVKAHNGDWQNMFAPDDVATFIQGVSVHDLRLDANTANNPEAKVANLAPNQDEQTWQNGVLIYAGDDVHVTAVTFDTWAGVWAAVLNGTHVTRASISHNIVAFAQNRDHPDYDNAMFYLNGANFEMTGNICMTPPLPNRGGRACMEAHSGPGRVFNNTSKGFQTLINVTNSYEPGGNPGDIEISGNVADDALMAIVLWPSDPNEQHNTKIHDNILTIDWVKHQDIQNAAGIIALHSSEAQTLAGDISVTDNLITFVAYPWTIFRSPTNTAGIGVLNEGGAKNWTISGNTITNAPGAGIVIGYPYSSTEAPFVNIAIEGNTIRNAGSNPGYDDQYRAGIYVAGRTTGLTVVNNAIIDTMAHTRYAWYFAHTGRDTYTDITLTGNMNAQGRPSVGP